MNEIAEGLRDYQGLEGATLAGGSAGLAFLFAELDQGRPRNGYRAQAERLILEAASAIEGQPLSPWFYSGFSGIAWAIERLQAMGLPALEELEEIDEALLGLVSRRPWGGHYDLIIGLVGIGVYALERLPRPTAARCLEEIVARLEERSTRSGPGSSWWTPAQHVPAHMQDDYPHGYLNFGAAHGMPAVVALLALSCRAGVAEPRARELATGGARWLLANTLPESPGARFPSYMAPDVPLSPSRSAWCYGDPGVVLCLLVAARALSDRALEGTVLEIARECAQRPAEYTQVQDAGICHGAAGLGHIYNRLYQATREPLFKQAATAWLTQALDLRRPGEGAAGYFSWGLPPGRKELDWIPDGTLLTGAAGVALALLAAAQPFPPGWDGMLMAAIPA